MKTELNNDIRLYGEYDKQDAEESVARYVESRSEEDLKIAAEKNAWLAAWFTFTLLKKVEVTHLTKDEVFSACCRAIMKSLKKFNPDYGFKFSTYATHSMYRNVMRENSQEKSHAVRFQTVGRADYGEWMVYEPYHHEQFDDVDVRDASRLVLDWINLKFNSRYVMVFKDRAAGITLEETAKKLGVTRERVRQMHAKMVRQAKEQFAFLRGGMSDGKPA